MSKKLKRYIRDFKLFFKRKRENKFDYIFSLGYNCEVAFRMYKYFDFEESSLFNWTFSDSIDNLIYALNNFDEIAKDDFYPPNPLWECKNTSIRFHGKADMALYLEGKADENILQKDKKDLIERLSYLKNKFLKLAKSDAKKLYVYKIKKSDIKNNYETEKLYNVLANLGARNFKLLIISEKGQNIRNSTNNDIIYREVDYFAPDECVTDDKYLNNGFDEIWDEFYCSKKRKKTKRYKFEK